MPSKRRNTAVFPGSFDPITIGHWDIVMRALKMFDHIYVGIGRNINKKCLFPLEVRQQLVRKTFEGIPNVSVHLYDGLTVDFCREVGAQFIIRGIRSLFDFDYEKTLAHINMELSNGEIETVFLFAKPEYSHVSSTMIRDIITNKGKCSQFLPPPIQDLDLISINLST
ncbi:MAG: pantetheine-phosphate adenylyltransferase [Chlorobi bacterium]|nr:pantetheine-phosphate adenylyltransferase [Chlorobiota bacterium]